MMNQDDDDRVYHMTEPTGAGCQIEHKLNEVSSYSMRYGYVRIINSPIYFYTSDAGEQVCRIVALIGLTRYHFQTLK